MTQAIVDDPGEPGYAVPVIPVSHDGIYPRCVYCRGENYAPAVLAYSAGDIPCAAVGGCGRILPAAYVTSAPFRHGNGEPCYGCQSCIANTYDPDDDPWSDGIPTETEENGKGNAAARQS